MQVLHIEGQERTPNILLDAVQGTLEITGRSIPEDAHGFYSPVIDWLNEYSNEANAQTKVKIYLEYLNTASSVSIHAILQLLASIHKSGKSEVQINWLYFEDDEDMEEVGHDFESMHDMAFTITAVKE